jgi:hypothetical protein
VSSPGSSEVCGLARGWEPTEHVCVEMTRMLAVFPPEVNPIGADWDAPGKCLLLSVCIAE